MGGPKNLGTVIKEHQAFNSDQAVNEAAKKKKDAESKGYTFKGPMKIDESGGDGKGNVTTSGVKKGTTTTTPGKSTYTYQGKKSSGVYDALNKEISGGLAKRKYGFEGTDV